MFFKTFTIFSNENLQKLKASGVILNFSKEKEEQEDNEAPEERDKKLQEQFDNRLTLIKQLPRGTIRDIDERNNV